MAKKVERKVETTAPAASAAAGADQLAVLHPEREVFLGGQRLVVREYGFVEGLKLRSVAQPFMDALYELAGGSGKPPTFTQIEVLLADHMECVIDLIAKAADVDPAFVATLNDEDGYRLMQEWWIANSGFFIRRVVQRLATERAVAALPAGRASTTRSSEPATDEHPPISGDSPPAR